MMMGASPFSEKRGGEASRGGLIVECKVNKTKQTNKQIPKPPPNKNNVTEDI